MKTSLLLLPIISLWCWSSSTQDQAERLYDEGVTFFNAGKYKEGTTDFENVINTFGESSWAPKALLALGNYYLNVETDHLKALTYYERIHSEYGASTEAPAAYYYKALIIERQGVSRAELESAVADLVRMLNLFPQNRWEAQAYALFGKLQFRLGDFDQCLSFIQRLEFSYPDRPELPESMLLSARAAYLKGLPQQTAMILGRLQTYFPNTAAAARAEGWLRLLSRFSSETMRFQTDNSFFGARPKRFSSPEAILVSPDDRIAIRAAKQSFLASIADGTSLGTFSAKDLSEFAMGRDGKLFLVYENRLVAEDSSVSHNALPNGNSGLKGIKSAAFDGFGRIFVVDGSARDLFAYSRDGKALKAFSLNRPRLVRCFHSDIWVLEGSGNSLKKYNSDLQVQAHSYTGLTSITDFCFDVFGNLYVLHEKGYQVSIFGPAGNKHININLKGGNHPLKQAQAIAVDSSGSLYLSDRRGGAVFRFH